MQRRNWLSRLFASPEVIPVNRIRASRAVFLSEEVQRVDMTIEIATGDKLRLELTPRQTQQLITQLSSAYLAINPPLRNYGGGVPFDGGS